MTNAKAVMWSALRAGSLLMWMGGGKMKNDEAMCGGHACPLKENCQRYLSGLESGGIGYWTVAMYKDGKCEQFKPIER